MDGPWPRWSVCTIPGVSAKCKTVIAKPRSGTLGGFHPPYNWALHRSTAMRRRATFGGFHRPFVLMAFRRGSVGMFVEGRDMHAPPPLPLRERAGERGAFLVMREGWPQHRSGGQSLRELSTLRLDQASSWPRSRGVAPIAVKTAPTGRRPCWAFVGAVLTAISGGCEAAGWRRSPSRRLQRFVARFARMAGLSLERS